MPDRLVDVTEKRVTPGDNNNQQALGPGSPDPFADLSKLRLSQDFASQIGVKKALLTVPVRKPSRQDFIRVHAHESYRITTAVLELKDDRETYMVAPALWSVIPGEITAKLIVTAINRQGVLFLWPIRLPGEDGRVDEWNRSLMEAADMATRAWVRVAANMSLGAYEVFEATGDLPEPEWPSQPFNELLRIAFKHRFIETYDHPVLKRLRGEA